MQPSNDYIFTNLIQDLRNTDNDLYNDSLINNTYTISAKKNFLDEYTLLGQLNEKGKLLKSKLELPIMTWVKNNFMKTFTVNNTNYINGIKNKLKKIYKNFIPDVITNVSEFDEHFDADFAYFFNLACTSILLDNANIINNLYLVSESKPQLTAEDVNYEDIKSYITQWYLNNLSNIYNQYIKNNANFSPANFLIEKFTSNDNLQNICIVISLNRNNYNSTFFTDLKQILSNYIKLFASTLPIKIEYSNYRKLEKQIINLIKKNINDLLSFCTFPKERTGEFTHSWLGFAGTRNDAKPIFKQLEINIQLANSILKQINQSVDKIERLTNTSWKDFIEKLYTHNYDEELQMLVRQYLVNKNISIHDKHIFNVFIK